MTPTVLLFDIDGTLLDAGNAGRRAMRAAFGALTGHEDASDHFSYAGMTDHAIARQGLTHIGREPTEASIAVLIDAYLERLEGELRATDRYRVLPGVGPVLDAVTADGVALGLGTGNVKRGAFAKLARGLIHEHFSFGGFGCDAEDRTELLRVGARRGAETLGVPFEECRVVVIGDTPKDVAAAKGIGAVCVGVATGGTSVEAMRALGAEHAYETLEHADVVGVLLGR